MPKYAAIVTTRFADNPNSGRHRTVYYQAEVIRSQPNSDGEEVFPDPLDNEVGRTVCNSESEAVAIAANFDPAQYERTQRISFDSV